MEGIMDLHHDLCFFLVVIVVFVMWMLFRSVYLFTGSQAPAKLFHGATLELVWTLAPSLVLLCIAVPSFGLLYGMEAEANPGVTIKAIGHQWYWSAPFHCGGFPPLWKLIKSTSDKALVRSRLSGRCLLKFAKSILHW